MKKLVLSICIGCALTWALYAYANHPRSGPTPFIQYVLVPLYLLLSFVSPSGPLGEMVGWTLTILLMSLVTYLAIWLFGFIFKKVKAPLNKDGEHRVQKLEK